MLRNVIWVLSMTLAIIGLVLGVNVATDAIEKYTGTTEIQPDSPHCFEIGETSELGGNCFCVDGDMDSVAELDCLVESRVIPSIEYEMFINDPTFRKSAGLPEIQVESPPTLETEQLVCFAVGKSSQLDGDCFCVEGTVDRMDEADCLLESGVVSQEQHDAYRELIETGN